MFSVIAIQFSDNIDVKLFKTVYGEELLFSDSDETFYKLSIEKYIYIFQYGVICFLNHKEEEIRTFFNLVRPFCRNIVEPELREEFEITTGSKENKVGYNRIELVEAGMEALRLIMLNVAESVALDYYSGQTVQLLEETNKQTSFLEKNGNLDISGKNLKKFIGRTINLKNRITENLYVFDSAPGTWDDENLFRMDADLKKTFDIQSRYRNIQDELQIVKDNLGLFIDIMHQRKSSLLEWVVIVLILVEVINLVIEKIMH